MLASANLAFAMYPALTQGAIAAIIQHGTPAQKAIYLPKLIEGRWTRTMNLTEPCTAAPISGSSAARR